MLKLIHASLVVNIKKTCYRHSQKLIRRLLTSIEYMVKSAPYFRAVSSIGRAIDS